MTTRSAAYSSTTAVPGFVFLSGGMAWLLRVDFAVPGMIELGYRAYAGIAFDPSGATFSHLATGHTATKASLPLLFLGVAAASWALRPGSRRLGGGHVLQSPTVIPVDR